MVYASPVWRGIVASGALSEVTSPPRVDALAAYARSNAVDALVTRTVTAGLARAGTAATVASTTNDTPSTSPPSEPPHITPPFRISSVLASAGRRRAAP